jgi:hypothetical protein
LRFVFNKNFAQSLTDECGTQTQVCAYAWSRHFKFPVGFSSYAAYYDHEVGFSVSVDYLATEIQKHLSVSL